MSSPVSESMVPTYVTNARSSGPDSDTVTPVRSFGSRVMYWLPNRQRSSSLTRKSPKSSSPTFATNATRRPSFAQHTTKFAVEPPSRLRISSARTSSPKPGRSGSPDMMRSMLTSPMARTSNSRSWPHALACNGRPPGSKVCFTHASSPRCLNYLRPRRERRCPGRRRCRPPYVVRRGRGFSPARRCRCHRRPRKGRAGCWRPLRSPPLPFPVPVVVVLRVLCDSPLPSAVVVNPRRSTPGLTTRPNRLRG